LRVFRETVTPCNTLIMVHSDPKIATIAALFHQQRQAAGPVGPDGNENEGEEATSDDDSSGPQLAVC
jgi:hypothetical protein